MRHVEPILCPFCGFDDLRRNGHSPNGTQRWFCKDCGKFFQRTFKYKGRLQQTKDRILEMVTNGSGIRDTSRVLGVSQNTVIRTIKKNSGRN